MTLHRSHLLVLLLTLLLLTHHIPLTIAVKIRTVARAASSTVAAATATATASLAPSTVPAPAGEGVSPRVGGLGWALFTCLVAGGVTLLVCVAISQTKNAGPVSSACIGALALLIIILRSLPTIPAGTEAIVPDVHVVDVAPSPPIFGTPRPVCGRGDNPPLPPFGHTTTQVDNTYYPRIVFVALGWAFALVGVGLSAALFVFTPVYAIPRA
ncbi:hypothetical protein BDK51DRAFT_42703 [Blyttiomyces helicus]|uniref:Uncharacterized protein n=1 Tax=Blyttiomyces helicus TaxID=388810 RepID=A0A4P9WG73_9FUNG|nr:hypothetical protein BDK51DRAFT_42703 [Blyttiomyces helicus]|eukprot:RKO91799.1 hypothetical protein BDK51DRAFT_42703 [Blyttiomyces helicus]